MKYGLGFLCRAVCFAMVCFCTTALYAAPVESASGTIYILLGTHGGQNGSSQDIWEKTSLKEYIQDKIVSDTAMVYCSFYDMSQGTPAEFAQEYLSRSSGKSILESALSRWYSKGSSSELNKLKNTYTSLDTLRKARPDVVPSRFVVIADGAAGLAVREYIQGPDYRGDIANVVFFNTPHEGTGLADQAVFYGTDRLDRGADYTKYATLVTLALAAYIVGGTDGLQEMMIGLLKDAVMGMAMSVGDVSNDLSSLYDGYSADYASTWYLTQDASETDSKYDVPSGKSVYLGGTQLLNAGNVGNGYSHPAYNVVYSFGLPSVGNGRRTLSDFAEQSKFHVSKEKLAHVLADSLKSAFGASAQENLDNLASEILKNEDVQAALDSYSQYSGKVSDALRVYAAFSELRRGGFNKDDIPGSAYKLLRIVDTFVPDSYKSEIYSLLIKYFSPEVRDAIGNVGKCAVGGGSVADCAKEGMALMAANLANYSLNFFDEGSFDVPYYSAMGANVAAFREASRYGYGIQDILENKSDYTKFYSSSSYVSQLKALEDYRDLLSDVGELETDRQVIDLALNVACEIVTRANAAYGKICSAAEFATNVALVGLTSAKVKKLAKNSKNLKVTHDLSLMATLVDSVSYEGLDYHGKRFTGSVPDIESMLFGTPSMSIASVRNLDGTDTVVVPLVAKQQCSSGEVLDWNSFNSLCVDPGWSKIPLASFAGFRGGNEKITVKDVAYGPGGEKSVRYANLEKLEVNNYMEEIRFQVDDLQPDSLRWIKLDFNTRIQIIYERDASGKWYVYFEESYKNSIPVDTLSASPVTPDGLFVFRPDVVIQAHNAFVKKNGGNHYEMGGLMEDGANIIYLAVMNKVGKVASAKLPFFYQATDFNANEDWPKDFARVSRLGTVSAFVNNTGYSQYSLASAGVKVSKLGQTAVCSDSVSAKFYRVPTDSNATSDLWKASASLDSVVATFSCPADGEYVLEWTFEMHNASGSTQTFGLKSLVSVDTISPILELNVPRKVLSGRSSDGIWGAVIYPDSSFEPIRGIRGMLVDALGNVSTLFQKTRHNARSVDIRWTASTPMPGPYLLVVQAFDFADPDSVSRNRLLNISDSDTSAWSYVTDSLKFKPGFNGTVLTDSVWIDNVAPSVVLNSIVMGSVRDTTASGCDSSKITRSGLVLNSCNLLSASFRVHEDLYGRKSSGVKVEVVFRDSRDSLRGSSRDYLGSLDTNIAEVKYRFVEPEANRLADGVYSVHVVLTDAAGNVSETRLADSIIVDRTAPSVYDVSSGGVAFDSAAVLVGKDMSALVSQNTDDPRNVSTLSCMRSLDAAGVSSGWKDAGTLAFAPGAVKGRLDFSIGDLVGGMPDGSWTVYIGCYDAAGNFSTGLDFFGVGARYPRITYPDTSLNSFYYGKVLVKGETPNPVLDGDGNMVSFKLSWKAPGDTIWHDGDFEYLAHGVGEMERDLAIWTLDSVSSGDDTLKLSVRACDTCAWVSSEAVVTVYSRLDPLHDTTETDIDIVPPRQQFSGTTDTITIELEHVSDTTAWKVTSTVMMYIAGDTSAVEASSHTFDPAVVSPFKVIPSSIDSGLYVWQDGGTWHVYWKGSVKGVVIDSAYLAQKRLPGNDTLQVPPGAKRHPPRLTLRYLADSTDSTPSDSLFSLAAEDSAAMGSVEVGGTLVPAYDRSATWALDSLGGDSLHLVFASGSAFTVDVSTVDSVYRNVYCGNRTADDALPDYGGAGVVYVYPQRYKMYHVWSGQNDGGIYADGDSAYVKVVAYSKADPSRIVTKEKRWNLLHESPKLVPGTTVPVDLYVGLDFSDTNAVMFESVAFHYGLHGRSAYVKEEVIGPNGYEKSLEMKFVYAGASNKANVVSWDGREAGTNFGKYMFRIMAYGDAAGTIALDTLEYEFYVKNRENFREADSVPDPSEPEDYPAVLVMDEAHLDSFGDLRYVGSIDYLMKAHASMNYLPEENRTFRYKWEPWTNNNGIARQAPAFYKKYRYSVGIRRHRDRFPVTVAVLLVTEGVNIKNEEKGTLECLSEHLEWSCSVCKVKSHGYPYKIKVFKADMLENGNGSASFSTDLSIDSDMDIVGHWTDGGAVSSYGLSVYNMGVAVKVFPVDVFDLIKSEMNNSEEVTGRLEDDLDDGETIADWNSLWNSSLYNENKNIGRWFKNWGERPVLWEGKNEEFNYQENTAHLSDESQEGSSPCSVDTSLTDSSVCGLSREDENNMAKLKDALESYNPHAGMMGIDIGPTLYNDYGIEKYHVGNSDSCKSYNGSFSNIGINLRFVVRSNYWHPQWGYNNLANRYVRFDPTNKTLFGDKGYFKSNKEDFDASRIDSADTARFKNHFGSNGWEYSYNMSDARISAFEAERFPMRQTGMNPLVFSDEIDSSTSLIPSMFSVTFFSAGMKPDFQVAACSMKGCNNIHSSAHTAMYEEWISRNGNYDPNFYNDTPNMYFVVAPVMTPGDAIIQDEYNIWVPYPYAGSLDTNLFEGTKFADTSYSLVYYPDLRSRIHVGVGDWDDDYWDSHYVSTSGYIINPVTGNPHTQTIPTRNDLDSLHSYSVKLSDTAAGLWSINLDSLKPVTLGTFRHGFVNGMVKESFRPVEVDSLGKKIQNSRWFVDFPSGATTWNITTGGDTLAPVLDYVFSADSTIAMNMETRKHSVPLVNVFRQNGIDSLLGNPWTKNLYVVLDSLLERDTLPSDTMLSRHPLLWASYNAAGGMFDVTWNGKAPTSRISEVATFRGRVPGAKAPWRLGYVSDGYTFPVAEGVQDTVPVAEPFPVLARFDMNHLQGPATFFLTWGSDGITNYRKLDLRVGNRVAPDSAIYVQSMYANVGVEFAAGAWGNDTVDVTVRTVDPHEYVFKTFKGLAVNGPVVEVLPSHDFGEADSLWPVVKIKLSHEDVDRSGYGLAGLMVYKPDFEKREIVPLESEGKECYKVVPGGADTITPCGGNDYDYVFIKAKTQTFSTFIVLDTVTAKSVVPVTPPPVSDTLFCVEPAVDTVWAGTYNGRLEFANPCTGRGNYLLQLRVGGSVAAEHQDVLSGPAITWEARRGDIWLPADVYTSRADYYGVDGSTERVRGPMIRVDSLPPSLSDFEVAVVDGDGGARVLQVSASLADSISGISNAVVNVRFGGYLAETRMVPFGGMTADTVLYEEFVLSPVLLHHCTGCRATVDVRVEDMGHNHVEESWRSGQLYPFPSSLVLWYPMSEGSGNVAHEMLAGLDLSLDSVNTPWGYGGRLSLFGLRDRSTTSNNLHADSVTPMSVEFDAIVGKRSGAVFTWHDDSTTLTLGIENGKFYVKVDSGTVELSYYVSSDVPEHCVFVFDTPFVNLYVDGNFVERVALPGDFVMRDNGKPILGYYFGEQSAYFRMSNLRVYRSALTAEQVQFLQNLDSLPPYREPGDTSAVDTSVVDSTPVSLVIRAVELDSVPGLVVDQSCAVPGRSYLRQGSGTSGKAVWNVDAPRAGNYALYVFGRGYPSGNSLVEVSVNGVNAGSYGLRPSGLWESSRMGDSLLVSLDSGMNRIELRPLGGAEIAGIAAVSSLNLPEAHLVDYGQSGWAAPEPRVEALISYENAYDVTWARPRIKLRNLTGQYIYGARVRYYYSGEGSAVAATSWYPEGPASVVHDAGDVYYAEYVLSEPIPPHGYALNGSAIQLGLHRTPDYKSWKIQDDPSYEHGSAYGYVEAKGVVVLDSRGVMLNGWNCVDDGMPATTPASGIRALAAEESSEPWKNSTIAVYVENNGSDTLSGFEARYYYRDATGSMEHPDWYYLGPDSVPATPSKVSAGGNLYYVSLVYNNVVLKPGKRSAAVKFGLHARGWSSSAYNAYDDPSYHGIGTGQNLKVADSVVVLDMNGNLLWGGVPRPNFSNNVAASDSGASRVTRVGDVVYVNIDQTGYYYLEVVDAFGTLKNRLFEGTWSMGEHTVQIPASAMQPGRYLVLRRGNTILNWQLLK